jgi:hypothetical protein
MKYPAQFKQDNCLGNNQNLLIPDVLAEFLKTFDLEKLKGKAREEIFYN